MSKKFLSGILIAIIFAVPFFSVSQEVFAATTIFSDNFNNDYGELSTHTPTTVGTSWTQLVNNGVNLYVQSYNNHVTVQSNTANGGSIYVANGTYPSADYEISADALFAAGDSNYTRSLILRAQDSNNMYLLRSSNTTMTIYKRVSGTWTSLASGGSVGLTDNTVSPYYIATLTFSVEGTTLTGKVNGVTKVTVTDSSITNAGKAGIGLGYTAVSTDDGGTGVGMDTVLVQTTSTDTTAPTITSVSSDTAGGSYNAGDVIDIDVTFSEAVTSTGSVTVTLETGATDRTCTFTVSNSSTGTCNYTVQAGDTSSDLTVNTISGTIADQSSNAMTDFVPATNLEANEALVIDTTSPIISEVTAVVTPTTDTTPDYIFTTDEAGTLAYGGSCSSATNSVSSGSNTITLTSLVEGTYSNCTITLTDTAGNSSNVLSITSFTIDTTAPGLSNISTSSNATTATITWTTDENSSTSVSYGLTNSYGTTTTETDTSTRVTSHSASITGLSCSTTYHYIVISKDNANNTSSDTDHTFTTGSCPSSASTSTSASSRVRNLINMGKIEEAQKLVKEFPSLAYQSNITVSTVPEKVVTKSLDPIVSSVSEPIPSLNSNQEINRKIPLSIQKNLKPGTISPEVKKVQEFFKIEPVTGKFGILTYNAVVDFQRKNNLAQDGIVGPKTMGAINKFIGQ